MTRTLRKQAEALLAERRHPEASALYEKICKTDRTDIDARIMLAITKIHTGDFDAAEADCRLALGLDGGHALAHHALGTALERQGRLQEAVTEFSRAIELRPGFANAHLFLANALTELGEFESAETAYREALRLEPNLPGAMAGLGRLYRRTGRPEAGEEWLRKALQLDPANHMIRIELGNSLATRGRQGEALPLLQQAVQAEPESGPAHYALGAALASLGQFDTAISHYRTACSLQPDDEYAAGALAGILERRGEFEQADTVLKPFVDAGVSSPAIALPFADIARHFGRNDEAAGILERALNDPALDYKTRTDLHFRLGKLLDACGKYDGAFLHYDRANRLSHERDQRLAGDDAIDLQTRRILQQLNALDGKFWRTLPQADNHSPRPVFVVGMPRSGTTLVEQILASHPDIHGAGELNGVEAIAESLRIYHKGYPDCLATLTSKQLNQHAGRHLLQLETLAPHAARVVDKSPHNFLHLGLISLLFPGARVIHLSRDARDTCLSIYFQIFAPRHAYASDLARLGGHYRDYQQIMRYWSRALDLPILDLRYEQLVTEPEQNVRRMIEFCELPWDDGCLDFHTTRRDVNTPSYDQVRQPMYMKSIGRWQHYRKHLAVLLDALQEDNA